MSTEPVTVRVTAGARMVAGDRLPVLAAKATGGPCCGGPFDFTGWTLTFELRGPVNVTGGGAVAADAQGNLTYTWAAGDTDWPGEYEAIFHGTSPDSKPRTFLASDVVRIIRP